MKTRLTGAVVAGLLIVSRASMGIIVTNVTWHSTNWYVDVTAVGSTATVTMRANPFEPTPQDFPAMTIQVTNLPVSQAVQFAGTLGCRSLNYYEDAQAILGCADVGVAFVCAAGEVPSYGGDTLVCTASYLSFQDGLQACLSGAGGAIAQGLNQSQAWAGYQSTAQIDEPTMSSVLDSPCTLASLWTVNSGTGPFLEVWPNHLSFGVVLQAPGATATNSFTIENIGGGLLTGTASASAPYSILSGATYNLSLSQTQIVTIAYNPNLPGSPTNGIITLTGGGESQVYVSASPKPLPPTSLQAAPPP